MNKKNTSILIAALLAVVVTGCSDKGDSPRYRLGVANVPESVAGMKMNKVEASSFTFNAAFTGRPIEGSNGPVQVLQGAFWISETPVDLSLWSTVMGRAKPYSYDDVEVFLDKLYKKTHLPFILPSEAMYEAARWQGAIKEQDTPVLVSDDWTDTESPGELQANWRYTEKGNHFKTVRTRVERKGVERFRRTPKHCFHLAVLSTEPIPDDLKEMFSIEATSKAPVPSPFGKRTFEVNGVSFNMLPVEGGEMTVGGTKEQEKYADGDENPVFEKFFQDFLIGETEVTAGLWQAVMGYLPAWNDKNYLDRPVVGVSWYDTKEFILKLNALTSERFRLPGEYEWEYAARGGRKSRGYVLSGGNPPAEVGVFSTEKKTAKLSSVKTCKPNELGLYDMSGNAWEWVQGRHQDGTCVMRGGSCASRSAACRVSNRQAMAPGQIKDTFGFRLAL